MWIPAPPLDPPALASLHLARPGHFTDMHGTAVDLSPALLSALAASYDPAIYAAPLVIGHPTTNAPAFGHLAKIRLDDAGLWGEPINVDPAFAAAVRDARYPNRSLSFWPADHPGNPRPGQPYIRHLGVLGAVPPAIPGLRGADLADGDAGLTVLHFAAPVPAVAPPAPAAVSSPTEDCSMLDPDPVALAAQVADLAAQAQALTARETALAEREAAAAAQAEAIRRTQAVAFCDDLASAARIRPADVPALAELVLRLDADAPAPCFAAPDSPDAPLAPGAWLRGWLAQLPPLVELSEIATGRRAGTAPGGLSDAEAARRARAFKAKQAAAGQPISFTEACAAVERNLDQDPE
jgi:hypothetical protein